MRALHNGWHLQTGATIIETRPEQEQAWLNYVRSVSDVVPVFSQVNVEARWLTDISAKVIAARLNDRMDELAIHVLGDPMTRSHSAAIALRQERKPRHRDRRRENRHLV
jgi:hypothetical protein